MAARPLKKEIRAVWLTTIYGLDWPKKPATTKAAEEQQKKELRDILDKLQDANFNTVFLQVRHRGDVIWKSAIEPVSATFGGKSGRMPGYDPVAFAVEECHKRGIECHAWFVTFPLGSDKRNKEHGSNSVIKKHPKLCKKHQGDWYLDPGVPGTAEYILSLVKELVVGYDLDGIHFDYIRYPEQAKSFPDKTTYNRAKTKVPLDEWRRENINKMVYMIYDWVKSVKPWVQVSSSPLGKYSRIPEVPNAGWTAYESVYQDPCKWLKEGKQDMIVPMMYYLHKNFFPFVDNWVANANGRLVVPGLGAYRLLKREGDWAQNDVTDQIDYSRYFGADGCAFFRCCNLWDNDKRLYDELKDNYYKYPAMLPPLTWLSDKVPESPTGLSVERVGEELKISWNATEMPLSDGERVTYNLFCSTADSIDYSSAENLIVANTRDNSVYLPVDSTKERGFLFTVTATNRYHIESKPSEEVYYYSSRYEK
jgi:uncharacterized lipoprotein YddW (UPF0748 family)